MLHEANNFRPNSNLVRQVDTNVPFLNVLIENKTGVLVTSVYHKQAAQLCRTPFKCDQSS